MVTAKKPSGSDTLPTRPTVTIAIPTYNEQQNLPICLRSLFAQDYPNELVDVLVVDGGSQDRTLEIAERFGAKLLHNKKRDGDYGKLLALMRTRTDLFLHLDADCELTTSDWLSRMVSPLVSDTSIVGSFTRIVSRASDPPISRFLSYDCTQRDPLYAFFSRSALDTVVEMRQGYNLCRFESGQTPPVGSILFRRCILNMLLEHMSKLGLYPDVDIPAVLAKRGYNRYAYVPVGLYHTHVRSLRELVSKRIRNLKQVYLKTRRLREYVWLDLSKRQDFAKLALWIFYVNILFPAFIKSACKSLKHHDWVLLYEALVGVAVTDALIYGFLSDARGRRMIREGILSIVRPV